MRKKRISILLGTAVLASMLAGCGGESQSGSSQSADAEEGGRMTLQLWTSSRDAIDHPDAWYIKKMNSMSILR